MTASVDDCEFEYGDVLDIVEGPFKGSWGTYDNDDCDEMGNDLLVLMLDGGPHAAYTTEVLVRPDWCQPRAEPTHEVLDFLDRLSRDNSATILSEARSGCQHMDVCVALLRRPSAEPTIACWHHEYGDGAGVEMVDSFIGEASAYLRDGESLEKTLVRVHYRRGVWLVGSPGDGGNDD